LNIHDAAEDALIVAWGLKTEALRVRSAIREPKLEISIHMTSIDYFEDSGRDPVEPILVAVDQDVLRIDGSRRHLLESVVTIRGLKAVILADGPHFPSTFALLGKLKSRLGNMPVLVDAEFPAEIIIIARSPPRVGPFEAWACMFSAIG